MSITTPTPTKVLKVYVAGVMYHHRDELVRTLRLSDTLILEREPDNSNDNNAVKVITATRQQTGYIPRRLAEWLAPWLDSYKSKISCQIIELEVEPVTSDVRLRISFAVPRVWVDTALHKLPSEHHETAYALDIKPYGAYLLLNGTVNQLRTIRDVLIANEINVISTGYSTWPSESGKQYEWYIKLERAVERMRVHDILHDRLELVSDEELLQELDNSRHQIQMEVQHLQTELRNRDQDVEEALDLSTKTEAQKQQKIDELLANIERINEERRNLGYQNRSLQEIVSGLAQQRQDEVPPPIEQLLLDFAAEHLTPQQSLQVIERLFSNRVVILDSAFGSAQDSDGFAHRKKLFELLWQLATDYYPAMCAGKGDDAAGIIFGSCFASQESGQTRENSTTRRARTFMHEGKSYYMRRHLKIGVKESANETIRVHFDWDAEKRMIIIGHCGRHLPLG